MWANRLAAQISVSGLRSAFNLHMIPCTYKNHVNSLIVFGDQITFMCTNLNEILCGWHFVYSKSKRAP